MTSRLAAPDRAATICRLFYSGSLVVRGSGLADVVATGPRSEIGKIGQSLQPLEAEPPRLQAQTARLVRLAALGGGAVSIVAVVLYGTLRGGWLDAVLAGITIGMSMLPEEFPVVLTVFMAMGAWRISKARVLTRRAASIETLGSVTVLCTDKTGTLTENRMSIAELRLPDGGIFACATQQRRPQYPASSGNLRCMVCSLVHPCRLIPWKKPSMNSHAPHWKSRMVYRGRTGNLRIDTGCGPSF
jgi:magnesium-transporting ATPase (P-type)